MILGHKPISKSRLIDRRVKRLIKKYPDVWPAAVVHDQARWQDMPADQFDWAIAQIEKRVRA